MAGTVYLAPGSATFLIELASGLNPDILAINSQDPNAAAAYPIVTAVPAVGTLIEFVIDSQLVAPPGGGPFVFQYTTLASDTKVSIAAAFAALINANATLAGVGINAQYNSGGSAFGIAHHWNDAISIGACAYFNGVQVEQNEGGVFAYPMNQGSAQLDAGPIIGLSRVPVGRTPQAADNVGQVQFAGPTVDIPGQIAVQYATICGNILDPHDATIRGEFEIDTAAVVNGQTSIAKRVGVSDQGVTLTNAAGQNLGYCGPGTINCTGLYVNGVKIA